MGFEIVLSLCQFCNIDIYQQGYYLVKVRHTGTGTIAQRKGVEPRPQKQHHLREACIGGDGVYESKVFYIRFREEKAQLSEIIHFLLNYTAAEEPQFSFELWFFERTSEEIQQKKPITPISDISQFKLVSTKTIGLSLQGGAEHFDVCFDMGFVSQLEINFLLVEKHQFDQFSNLSYQMLRSRDRDDGTQRLSEKKQVLKSLQATYDQLRYFKDGVSQFLPPTKDRHFGPVIFDTNVQVNQTPLLMREDDKASEHSSCESRNRGSLGSKLLVCANLNKITSRISPRDNNSQKFVMLSAQPRVICKQQIRMKTPDSLEPKLLPKHPQSLIHPPRISRAMFHPQQSKLSKRRQSDEISSSSESELLAQNLSSQKQQHKNIKSLVYVKNARSASRIDRYQKIQSAQQADENVPDQPHDYDLQRQSLGQPSQKNQQLQTANANATRAVYLVQELFTLIVRMQEEHLAEVNRYLKRKWLKQQAEQFTRIIIQQEEEYQLGNFKALKTQSIRQSAVRKSRRQPFQQAFPDQEVEQEGDPARANKRGQLHERPNLLKLVSPSPVAVGATQRQQRHQKVNLSQQPIQPGAREKSVILASKRRNDVSQQPAVSQSVVKQPIKKPAVYLIEPQAKKTTEPIILEEVYFDEDNLLQTLNLSTTMEIPHQKQRPSHLFVFVHGFQATAQDLQIFKNCLHQAVPHAMFLVSKSNEKCTEKDIRLLGLNLANEVQKYIKDYFTHLPVRGTSKPICYLKKLTFVAHSLGGIIVRESLKHLTQLREQMHGFVCLGSPHLGYMYNSNSLVDAGMWLIKNWTKSDSLSQLTMTDADKPEESYLFELSKCPCIGGFKYIILVGSYQDSYVPYDSARIQVCLEAIQRENKHRQTYIKMTENILGNIQCRQLYRLDVNFKLESASLANMIGRTAHIQMIESEALIQALIHKYQEIFSS